MGFGCIAQEISVWRKCVKCVKGHRVREDMTSVIMSEVCCPWAGQVEDWLTCMFSSCVTWVMWLTGNCILIKVIQHYHKHWANDLGLKCCVVMLIVSLFSILLVGGMLCLCNFLALSAVISPNHEFIYFLNYCDFFPSPQVQMQTDGIDLCSHAYSLSVL